MMDLAETSLTDAYWRWHDAQEADAKRRAFFEMIDLAEAAGCPVGDSITAWVRHHLGIVEP